MMKKCLMLMFLSVLSVKSAPAPYVSSEVQSRSSSFGMFCEDTNHGIKAAMNNVIANEKNIKRALSDNKQGIKIFPNPASTFIVVEYNCESDGELILYNSLGQEILITSLEKGNKKVQIQISDIANGMYQYKCKFENCIEQIGKLTIQK